jgi:AcrR family transcriptional regulator
MSTKLQERQKQRQDEIITAARRCFRASGFHGASMSQIASEAQLSVGQIYRYFSSKDAIIEEMIRRIIDSRIAEMEGKIQTDRMPKMMAWRQTVIDWYGACVVRCTRGKQLWVKAFRRAFRTVNQGFCLHASRDGHCHQAQTKLQHP